MPGGTHARNAKGERTRKALLDAAGRVFAQNQYGDAHLKEISAVAGVNTGLIHFYFGNKEDLARALLKEHQTRIDAVLVEHRGLGDAAEQITNMFLGLSALVSIDPTVQAGVKLSISPPVDLAQVAEAPYVGWQNLAAQLIREGIADGSVNPKIGVDATAQFIYELFIGAQVSAGTRDEWATLPETATRLVVLLHEQLVHPVWLSS